MGIYCDYTIEQFANGIFELIEDQTIDIDSIKEMGLDSPIEYNADIKNKIDELVRAVKYLNKEIQSIKENSNCCNMEISEKDINEAIKNARRQIKEEGI